MHASRFRLALALPALVLAAQLPRNLAPHEANACSGGPGNPLFTAFRQRTSASVANESAVALDTVVITTQATPGAAGTHPSSPPNKALKARLETADGTLVPLARNDFESDPPTANGEDSSVLRPATPLIPSTSYFAIVEGLQATAGGATETVKIAFTTGAAPYALPAKPMIAEGPTVFTVDDMPSAETFCCTQNGFGGCGQSKEVCRPRYAYARELRRVVWTAAAGLSWEIDVESTRDPDEAGWQRPTPGHRTRAFPAGTSAADVPLAAGEKACARLFAVDTITGDRTASDPLCWEAASELPAAEDACQAIRDVFVDAASQYPPSCGTSAEAICPGASGAGGASGSGAGGGGAGSGSGEGGSGGGGEATAGAGGSAAGAAGGAAAGAPSGGAAGRATGSQAGAGQGGGGGVGTGAAPADADGCSLPSGGGSSRSSALLFVAALGSLLARARRLGRQR